MHNPSHTQSDMPIVLARDLTKVFKDFWMRSRVRAVDHLDLEVHKGEIFGLLGPNGSGKSTTIKLLLGLLHKTSGYVAVLGKPPSDVAVKERIGVLPEESYLYPFLNARETLDYYGKLFGLHRKARTRRIDELLDMVGLTAVAHRQVHEYSKGMQRRIGLAQALINDPDFLVLDEPTSGLDPIGVRQVKDLIIELGRRGKTVLLSSHQLSDVEDCVDRLVILYGGKKRAEGTCDELLTEHGRMIIETDELDDRVISEIDKLLHERAGVAIRKVARPRQRLEDLFMDIVEHAHEEKIETHGAEQGGATASFLLTDDHKDEAVGEDLIEQLVSSSVQEDEIAESAVDGRAASEPADEPHGVIESLVSETPVVEDQPVQPVDVSSKDKKGADLPDLGVIESLLKSDENERDTPASGSESG